MTVRVARHLEVKLGDGIKATSVARLAACANDSCAQFAPSSQLKRVYTTIGLVLKPRSFGQIAKDVAFLPAAPEFRLV